MTKKKETSTELKNEKRKTKKKQLKNKLCIEKKYQLEQIQNKKRILWLVVSMFTLVIFILWGYAIKISLTNVNFKDSQASQIIKKSQQDWNEIFAQTQDSMKRKKQLEEIKANLKKAILNINNTTSTNNLKTSSTTLNGTTKTANTSTINN